MRLTLTCDTGQYKYLGQLVTKKKKKKLFNIFVEIVFVLKNWITIFIILFNWSWNELSTDVWINFN